MKIALIHFRVGETDGVSLEMDKWKKALINIGHDVIYISGNNESEEVKVIEEIAYNDKFDSLIGDECYNELRKFDCKSLKKAILDRAKIIKRKFIKIFHEEELDCIVPNNIFALAKSLPTAIGLFEAIKETGIRVINHHHDFYWEREKYSSPTCSFINSLLVKYFPPKMDNMSHAVINSAASEKLMKKKQLASTVVPNVFDFNAPLWKKDDYNSDFKSSFELTDNDVVFLQATRVTNRKSIELTISLISDLNNKLASLIGKTMYDGRIVTKKTRLVLLVVGLHEGLNDYENRIIKYAKNMNVKMVIDPSKVGHTRSTVDKNKVYSLWDAYVYADIVSYPSIYEGWGNQFLEGLFAKKPMIVFEYSVFEKDIAPNGFNYISLGNEYEKYENGLVKIDKSVIAEASNNVLDYLFNNEKRVIDVEENFNLGKKHYSIEFLVELLNMLF
ncbi:MAG: glycosyltransferase family 4 protein [Tenericutes bacterium]|nr:glycosyltransferase family 4 protein [Mycoplasmatota bacterium]